ncbi:SdpI family protein [Paenibacillus sp. S-38]|uniref:SdpI family protein n=1 Tax=Paenibacillus sp. S-38 TaxID=3416710 RepID=UPI003CF534AC
MKRYLPSITLLVLTVALSFLVYPYLPEQMAVHFRFDGTPDGFMTKAWALATPPLFMLLLMAAALLVPVNPSDARTLSARTLVRETSIALLFGVHIAIILYGMGYTFDMAKYVTLLMGIVFLITGNYMPRFQPNYYVGIRTPWTLASEENWRRTHRTAGKIWFIGGLLMFVCLLLPEGMTAFGFLFILIAVIGITLVVSFYHSRGRA